MQEKTNGKMSEIRIDLQELLLAYLKKWWAILICLIIGAAAAFGFTYQFVTPMYQASISIYVNNNKSIHKKEKLSSADLAAAQQLVNTYMTIAKSNRVLNQIAAKLNGEYSSSQLSQMIRTAQLDDTETFCIYVLHENPEEAARIANTVAEVAPGVISDLIEGTSARVIDTARVPQSRYSPDYGKMTLLGGVLGVFAAVGVLTIHILFDTHIHDENDLQSFYPLSVLGRIPEFELPGSQHSYGYSGPSCEKEATRLRLACFSDDQKRRNSIQIGRRSFQRTGNTFSQQRAASMSEKLTRPCEPM